MKKLAFATAAVLGLAFSFGVATTAGASSAPGDTAHCKFIYEKGLGKGFTANKNTVSVNVIVKGNEDCRKDFVLASFKIPHDTLQPFPVEEQTLFDHTVLRNVRPGTYKMTVKVPNCFHQVDLALGTSPTGPNGRLPYEKNRLLNAYLGGDKKCVEETPKTPVVPKKPEVKSVKTLPKTGAGSIAAGFVSVSAISGLGYNLIARKRK
ncbi:MAG: hypothetical protein M3Q14_00690 [bacterium]|nr:hypothetical protein [bacterium]